MYQICIEARVFYIMINEKSAKKFCCEDLSLIENYELAINDTTQTWYCHHILGEQFDRQYLINNNLYENRPSCELKFVTLSEHNHIHNKSFMMREAKKGIPMSDATKKAISEAHKGVPLSEAHKKALSEAHKGKRHSEATKKAMSESRKCKRHSEMTKKAISESHKGVPLSEEHIAKLSKKILQFTKSSEFIKEWPSAMEASRQLGIAQSGICRCCNGIRKYAGGYVWKYL